jgi:hypothetical protein
MKTSGFTKNKRNMRRDRILCNGRIHYNTVACLKRIASTSRYNSRHRFSFSSKPSPGNFKLTNKHRSDVGNVSSFKHKIISRTGVINIICKTFIRNIFSYKEKLLMFRKEVISLFIIA